MLAILFCIPFLGALILIMFKESEKTIIKQISLGLSLIIFIISLNLLKNYDISQGFYQLNETYLSGTQFEIILAIDGISLSFILLTTFIIPFCFLSSWSNVKISIKFFNLNFIILSGFLLGVFIVTDLLIFYIFFEAVLIPLFFIVFYYGGSKIKIRAAFLLFLYTLIGSLIMLLCFLYIINQIGSSNFILLSNYSNFDINIQKYLFLGIFFALAIKTPLVPFHGWLFRAHAEAPVAGSIILAAVILKLATYGFLRILLSIVPDACLFFTPIIQTFSILTIIYSSLATFRQTDIKQLVAYSSVAHIGVVLLGLFSNNLVGLQGAIILSLAHGLVSPALFFLLGGVLYDRYHTRIIKYYRGLSIYFPIFSVFYFIFTLANTGVPLSINWIGEIICLTGSFQSNSILTILASFSIFLSAGYSFFIFNKISFGSFSPYINYSLDLNRREFAILLPLLLLTFYFGIKPQIFLNLIEWNCANIILINTTVQ